MTNIIIDNNLLVSNTNFVQYFNKNKKPTPLDFLEMSIAACIGLEIQEYMQKQLIKACPFLNIYLRISNNVLKINCVCDVRDMADFRSIVDNCYITSNIKFEKNIVFAK